MILLWGRRCASWSSYCFRKIDFGVLMMTSLGVRASCVLLASSATGTGPIKKSTTMAEPNAARIHTGGEHDQQLATLVSMGFDAVQAEEALEASKGKVDDALGYLLKESDTTASDLDNDKKPHAISVRPKHPRPAPSHRLLAHHVPWTNPNEQDSSNAYQETAGSRKHGLKNVDREEDGTGPEDSKQKAPGTSEGAVGYSQTNPVTEFPPTGRSESAHLPGAHAVHGGTASLGPRPPPPPFRPALHSGDETYLVSAHVVSGEEDRRPAAPSGPLVLASPMPIDDDDARVSRRDMKRFYIFGCVALLLVLVSIGVGVALVFLLADDSPVPTGITEATGPPALAFPTIEPSVGPTSVLSPEPMLPTAVPLTPSTVPPTTKPSIPAPSPQPFEDTTSPPTPFPTPLPTGRGPTPLPTPIARPPTYPPTPAPTEPPTRPPTPLPTPNTSPPTPVPTRPLTEPPTRPPTPFPTSTTRPPTPVPTRPLTRPPTQPPSLPPTFSPSPPPSAPDVCATRLPTPRVSVRRPCTYSAGRQSIGEAGCEIYLDNWKQYPDKLWHESCVRVINSDTSAVIREQCYGFDESIYFSIEAFSVQTVHLVFEDSRCPLADPYTSNDVDLEYEFETP